MVILFVCTGNTCRSPIAEGFARELASRRGPLAHKIHWCSAGLAANAGFPADPEAVEVLSEEGIDISDHQTQSVSLGLIRSADLILTMTLAQKEEIVSRFPFVESRVFALKEYAFQAAQRAERTGSRDAVTNPLVLEIMNLDPGAAGSMDIDDPAGGSSEVYHACACEIRAAVLSLLDTIEPE